MLLNTLRASWLENMLAGKDVIRASKGTIRTSENVWCYLILSTNIEIQKYYDNEYGVYSRNTL